MELVTVSIADRVFSEIESSILCGHYKIGDIITETKLSEEYGVSRTPIREAVRRLEQEKLVKHVGKGVCILGIGKKELMEIYEIRLCLEGYATRSAALLMTDEEKASLKEITELQKFYLSSNLHDKMGEADSEFHSIIYSSCGSETMKEILTSLHRKTQMYRKMSIDEKTRKADAVGEHAEICQAIINGDAEKAAALATAHIKNAMDNIQRILV